MSISEIFNRDKSNNVEKRIYASSFARSTAAGIDVTITLFLRVFCAQAIGMLYINGVLQNFLTEFRDHFGTDFVKNNPDHIDFTMHHPAFIKILIFYAFVIFIGAIYHAFFNSSSWMGTIGKRIMKITVTKSEEEGSYERISFLRGLSHYFLSVLPFVFILYLVSFQMSRNLTFFQAVTASQMNLFLGFLFVIWVQIHLFTKRKTTAYDLICKTVLIQNRTAAKFPWSKI